MVVPAGHLSDVLGIREVRYVRNHNHLAVIDRSLSGADPAPIMAAGEAAARANATASPRANANGQISISNFAFAPKELRVPVGKSATWVNRDDTAHRIQSADNKFSSSPILDTRATYVATFAKAGEYPYFCSIHPTMTGKIIVG
jgi:plastocyanin